MSAHDIKDPDHVFSRVIEIMWWLYATADEQGEAEVRDDLLVAINELEAGPWHHVPCTVPLVALPFTVACVLLDVMLEELHRVTPGLGARVALTRARRRLDPR